MKRLKNIGVMVVSLAALVLSSCSKTPETTALKMSVADVAASSATISIECSGPAPELVRMTEPIAVEAAGLNLEDEAAIMKYAADNGTAVSLPYTNTYEGLAPVTKYVVVAVAFDANFQPIANAYVVFDTLVPDNVIGDESGAGSVDNVRW